MNEIANIEANKVAVTPIAREDDGTFWLRIDVPNGWDDVKKICKRVLSFEGRDYVFMSWNSDTLTCAFKASNNVATFAKRSER